MRTPHTLQVLHELHLLDEEQLHRLAPGWQGQLRPLVEAGLLTAYQARQIARGRGSRLRLGPYLLVERLGSGGEGVVYLAQHLLLDRLVALKILRPQPGLAARQVARLARLSHPHLQGVYDAWTRNERLVLALEYVHGVDLARLVAETGPLPFPLVEAVARQVASALGYLQSRGLVHRDIKPANLILIPDADLPLVKLIDMSGTCEPSPGRASLCGSPDYLAPELGLGEAADVRSDLYALGCTLYELLTGRVPYPGGDALGKLLRHRLEEPEPIERLRPDTPVALIRLVERLMQRDPEQRLSQPQQVASVLETAADKQAPILCKGQPQSRAWPRSRAWPWAMALLLGLGLGAFARLGWERPWWPSLAAAVPQPSQMDLTAAFREAPAGAVITLHEPGPYFVSALRRDQPLTVRAAPGVYPRLVRTETHAWQPLIETSSNLTLEGLALHDQADVPLLAVRQGAQLRLRGCLLETPHQAVNLEVADAGSQQVEVVDCEICVRHHQGAALLFWRGEREHAARVRLTLRRTTIEAGRILAVQNVLSPVQVHEVACRLRYRHDRISYAGYLDSPDEIVDWSMK
jgi:hypothetical protein